MEGGLEMNIQDFMLSAGKGACLALCYIRTALGKDATPTQMFGALWKAVENGIVGEDMFVKDAIGLMMLTNPNKTYNVVKKNITTLNDLNGELAAVNFEHKGFNHFILVENGNVLFDSLDDSKCVTYGKPTSARIIRIIEG